MSVYGIARYQRLLKNIANPGEYLFRKGERRKRALQFTTRPHPIHFSVPASLYQVFKEIFMEDFYEIDTLVKKLPAEPVVDIGANAGFFNVLLLSRLPKARIFAYEPMPGNIAKFSETISRNPSMQGIRLFQKAVTGKPIDALDLYTEDAADHTVVSSVFSSFNPLNSKKITVPAQSLTALIEEQGLTTIDLLKLDCEGSEYDILYHTDPALLTRARMLVIEVHQIDEDRNNVAALDRYLGSIGYTNRILPVQEGAFYLEAVKKEA
jgi:FkbM family methyltransferase